MIYPKYASYEIYSNSTGLTDKQFIISVYLDEIATLVRESPKKIVKILRRSKIPLSDNPTRRELINKLIDGVYVNPTLRLELAKLIAKENAPFALDLIKQRKQKDIEFARNLNFMSSNKGFEYNYFQDNVGDGFGNVDLSGSVNVGQELGNTAGNVGGGVAAGAQAGGPVGAIIGAVVGLTESIFDWKSSKLDAETQADAYKLAIFEKVSQGEKKNYTPLIIVGVTLLLGTIVLVFALRK